MKSTDNSLPEWGKVSRRDFLKLVRTGAISLGALAVGGAGWSSLVEPGWIQIENVTLKLPRLTSRFFGTRIAQISDIHIGGWMNAERLQHAIDQIITEKPDLLLLTGDFLIGHTFDRNSEEHLQSLIAILAPLAKSIPSFGVLGNHDYWTNADAIREMLQQSGITDLTNSTATISRDSEALHLCGVDDVWEGDVKLDDVVAKLPKDGAAVLLAHEPDFADESAATGRFDLQVSGHSHGGQVVIPFYGAPILPFLGQKYPSGLYQVGSMFQYTNRGLGMIDPPVRFNCPPEITIFTLEG
ncbi:MAG: metallophosphoesterase [Anaerolineales bacterium]|nr:metallophosphoesterase [Anaerolineales bacterium]